MGDVGAGAEPDIRRVVRTGLELRSASSERVRSSPYADLPTWRQSPGHEGSSPEERNARRGGVRIRIRAGAAGLLPRLEYNTLSNLAGGYPDDVAGRVDYVSGWSLKEWGLLLEPGSAWYAGVTVLALALVAPLVARRRYAVPYFAVLSLCALVLSYPGTTPLHVRSTCCPFSSGCTRTDPSA